MIIDKIPKKAFLVFPVCPVQKSQNLFMLEGIIVVRLIQGSPISLLHLKCLVVGIMRKKLSL
ncbi:unnamed protein product, partial [Vitis vinifera]|uniref:Uncharacterized protein n=1 Tax=Vitis vinifera TaxID=29760 RepID=D7TK40_VITVI